MPTDRLDIRSLSKSFGDAWVFADVSFTVEQGEVVALTGVNGSGKSTLLQCIVGANSYDSGQVRFEGRPYAEQDADIRAAVAVDLAVGVDFADLTVREHLEFVARGHGNARPDRILDEVMDELGLSQLAHRFPFRLSQGQRRRLGLASCFVRPFRLLVLDEPEQNLDTQGREWLAHRIARERTTGASVLLACHDAPLVAKVADSEVVLGDSAGDGADTFSDHQW